MRQAGLAVSDRVYVVRERQQLWGSRPSVWLMLSSVIDISIITTLSIRDLLMAPLPLMLVGSMLAASIVFAFVLDRVKIAVFTRLKMT